LLDNLTIGQHLNIADTYSYMMNKKIVRIMKVEVTPIPDGDDHPSQVFHEISKEYGRKLDAEEIKRELEKRF